MKERKKKFNFCNDVRMSMRINMIHEITVKQAEVLLDWRD